MTKQRLIIVRGLPVSGKSTFAKSLGVFHVESDMFFMKGGEYQFDIKNLKENHNRCQQLVRQLLSYGCDVVVSNTFTQYWELAPYLQMAVEDSENIEVVIYRATGSYKSVHDVPENVLENMKKRFEPVEREIFV